MNQALPKYRHTTQDKIKSFLNLRKGWHFGEGVPPSLEVVDCALKIVNQADFDDIKTNAFPGICGELLVTLYQGDVCYEFIINTDLSIDFVEEKKDIDVRELDGLHIADALNITSKLCEAGWETTLGASKKSITTRKESDSSVSHSAFQATEVSPSLRKIVSTGQAKPYVGTLVSSTDQYLMIPQYSSNFPWWISQADAA